MAPIHHVHCIGIGGIAVSAMARWFLAQNWAVSGSDVVNSPLIAELRKEGIEVKIGAHKASSLPQLAELVIHSLAVTPDNPEYKAALKRGIQTYSYPEMVGILSREHTAIAVAGAHGKSTTTALVSTILIHAHFDPTIFIGTKLKELDGKNFRLGRSEYMIVEADEYGRAFHNYSPFIIVVTNIDAEHLDVYKNLDGVKESFLLFFENLKEGGYFVLNRDDVNLYSLKSEIEKIALKKNARAVWFSNVEPLAQKLKKIIKLPGAHNVSNALGAMHAGALLNIPEATSLSAVASFTGAWRRMEERGKCPIPSSSKSSIVYDDYAHHPVEIRASLRGFREKYPNKTIVCVFQPHQAKRLEALFEEFSHAFSDADIVFITSIYKVPGRDNEKRAKYNSWRLAERIKKERPDAPIFYLDKISDLKNSLKKLFAKSSYSPAVVVMMGAGNIVDYTERLVAKR